MRLSAINGLADKTTGNPISLASSIALRDFVAASGTLATTTVTFTSAKPVHGDHCNTLLYDWHVGAVDPNTLQPK
jgi:prepilin-type processing-associated H-X9-DG protein